MMKRLTTMLLPLLLATQIPLSVTKLVPPDWKENLNYGVKWTSLFLNSYSALTNDREASETVPDGVVTVTVAMAMIPSPEDMEILVDREICNPQFEIAMSTRTTLRIQREFHKKFRVIETRSKAIQL